MTPIEIERAGAMRVEGEGRVDRGVAALSPARDRRSRSGSPAAQAGLKTFDFVTAVNGAQVGTWTEFARAVERAGASPLRLNYLRGGYSAVAFAHIEIEEPGLGGRHPGRRVRPGGTSPLRDRHPVGRAVRVLGRAGEPGRPDRPSARRSDPDARRRAVGALGSPARAPRLPSGSALPHRLGLARRGPPRGELPAGGPLPAGRLPSGGAAPGVRRAQPPRLEDGPASPDHEPLRLRARPFLRADRRRSSPR